MTEGAEMKGERIAQLELLLRSHPEGIRRAEIARRLGVHRSTISRYVEELANYIDIYEENNLIKIRVSDDEPSNMELSIYECLAFNMGAEALAGKAEFANPHLASGLRKLAMNMKSYAPKISENALSIADRIDKAIQENRSETGQEEAGEYFRKLQDKSFPDRCNGKGNRCPCKCLPSGDEY